MPIKFAPYNTPLERRIETFAVLAFVTLVTFTLFPSVIIISVYVILYTTYLRWLYLAYVTWIFLVDKNTIEREGRSWQWVKSWKWWKLMAKYFPVELVKLPWGELDPKKNYLFCCFPHGMLATGAFLSLGTEANDVSKVFPHHKGHMHTLRGNLLMPLTRELWLWLGALSSSAQALSNILSTPGGGHFTALVVGGAQEAHYSKPNHYKLILKNRKGFVKIALKNGSPLVPVMSFGEPDIMSQVEFEEGSICNRFQMMVKKYVGFVPIVPVGRGIFQYDYGILPRRNKISVVVGEPINVDKVEQPSQEQIDALHGKFIKKLTELFESQKKNYLKDCENIHLEIL